MKHLAVAFIIVALVAANLASDLWIENPSTRGGWDGLTTFFLIAGAWWFYWHRGDT